MAAPNAELQYVLISLAIGISACATPQAAPPAQAPVARGANAHVGMQEMNIVAEGRAAFTARIWYPTEGGERRAFRANAVLSGYQAVPDGVVALRSPAPLVILLHGAGGSGEGLAWIALDLVAHGAIAVAADHPASAFGDGMQRTILDVWEQPSDVRALLNHLEGSEWAPKIDRARIAVVGFSLGGLSAMLLAGTRLEFARVPEFCKTHHDGACEGLGSHFASFDVPFFVRANRDYADHRIRAAVAIAPGFTEAMTAASLQTIAPTLIITGKHDQVLPPETRVRPMLAHLRPPSSYREIATAQHFSFLPLCHANANEVLAGTPEAALCQERSGTTREQIHNEALEAITSFLLERGVLDRGGLDVQR